ncbi:MAG: hypothetical protein QME66_08320 [Candidatus Eisenbacteria bacterium]|nr:hypothetical protein [Candidatus Eisenbacteria bacterium]
MKKSQVSDETRARIKKILKSMPPKHKAASSKKERERDPEEEIRSLKERNQKLVAAINTAGNIHRLRRYVSELEPSEKPAAAA